MFKSEQTVPVTCSSPTRIVLDNLGNEKNGNWCWCEPTCLYLESLPGVLNAWAEWVCEHKVQHTWLWPMWPLTLTPVAFDLDQFDPGPWTHYLFLSSLNSGPVTIDNRWKVMHHKHRLKKTHSSCVLIFAKVWRPDSKKKIMIYRLFFYFPVPPTPKKCLGAGMSTKNQMSVAISYCIMYYWYYQYCVPTSISQSALELVAAVADVRPVVRRKTYCFFLYSSPVRNFSCSAWNIRTTSPWKGMVSSS